jgi:hypothetical protein
MDALAFAAHQARERRRRHRRGYLLAAFRIDVDQARRVRSTTQRATMLQEGMRRVVTALIERHGAGRVLRHAGAIQAVLDRVSSYGEDAT